MLSLYIHIPFCDYHCRYCSFAVIPTNAMDEAKRAPLIDNYLQMVEKQIIHRSTIMGKQEIKTVYIGGGTPSILSAADFFHIHALLDQYFDLTYLEERTIEVNPNPFDHVLSLIETVTTQRSSMLKLRRSIGIQTFDNTILEESGRKYTFLAVVDFLRALVPRARKVHCSFNLDFIAFGRFTQGPHNAPKQFWNPAAKEFFVALAKSGHFDSFSLYALELFDGSPRYHELPDDHKLISGKNKYGSDDDIYEEYATLKELLVESGYTRYELSNYSLIGRNSVHNRLYRSHGDYLGLGLHASSGIFSAKNRAILHNHGRDSAAGYRRTNPKPLKNYEESIQSTPQYEALTPIDILKEKIFLGLRVKEGLSAAVLLQCHDILTPDREKKCLEREEGGFCLRPDGGLRLTDTGMDVYNTIMTELIK